MWELRSDKRIFGHVNFHSLITLTSLPSQIFPKRWINTRRIRWLKLFKVCFKTQLFLSKETKFKKITNKIDENWKFRDFDKHMHARKKSTLLFSFDIIKHSDYDTSAHFKVTLVTIDLPLTLLLLLLQLLLPQQFLLPSELQDLAMRIRVLSQHKRRARSGSVFGHEPTRLVAYAARVTKSLRAEWSRPPLRRLLWRAVRAPPHSAFRNRRRLPVILSLLLRIFWLRLGCRPVPRSPVSCRICCRLWTLASSSSW